MLIYLLILVILVVIYRAFNEGFNNPFGDMEKSCLYDSDVKPAIKTNDPYYGYIYTNQNDFMNYNYYSILNKTDSNVYLSSNKNPICRI